RLAGGIVQFALYLCQPAGPATWPDRPPLGRGKHPMPFAAKWPEISCFLGRLPRWPFMKASLNGAKPPSAEASRSPDREENPAAQKPRRVLLLEDSSMDAVLI